MPAAPDSADVAERTAPLYPSQNEVEAPDFALEQLNGETFRLSDERGNVVVLNAWGTWCAPCREEMPDFVELQEELGPRGLRFVGAATREEGVEDVRSFAESIGVNYPIVVDDGTVEELYGPYQVMPTTYVIDRQGRVRYYAPGMLTKDTLRPVLVDLLEEGSA